MYIRFYYYFLNFNLVKKNKRSFGEVLIKARSVMYAKQRRGRLAGGWGVGGCVGVCGGGWGTHVSKCVIVSSVEEEVFLLLYLQCTSSFP